MRFGLLGAAGYIAPRHMEAILATNHHLVAACDPYDGVGVLDRYFPHCRFFTEIERFGRFIELSRRKGQPLDYMSICSPNHLHDAHCRLALRAGMDAICEKPLVISPWNLDQLVAIENETGCTVYTILQLRLHREVERLKANWSIEKKRQRPLITLTYITRRGPWYHQSWKGDESRSGGVGMNIGIHFFDLLIWIFGAVKESKIYINDPRRMSGFITLQQADVRWYLSIADEDLRIDTDHSRQTARRELQISDEVYDFTDGFENLHTQSYRQILDTEGFTIEDTRASIELVHRMRHSTLASVDEFAHPFCNIILGY